jgi:hypothetical protein
VFYFSVFLSEALGITPNFVKKVFAKKHKTHLDKLIKAGLAGDKNEHVVHLEMNPMQTILAEERAAAEATKASEAQIKEMEEIHIASTAAHAQQILHLKKKTAQGNGGIARKRGKKKKGRQKKEMAQIAMQSSKDGYDEIYAKTTETKNKESFEKKKKRKNSFVMHKDDNTGSNYFHNLESGETTWELPEGAELLNHEELVK